MIDYPYQDRARCIHQEVEPEICRFSATPIIKYAGGKTRLLDEIERRIPRVFLDRIASGEGTYFEPFVGGAAVFFRIAPIRAVLGDTNAELINLYRQVGSVKCDDVIAHLRKHEEQHNKRYYYRQRSIFNECTHQTPAERAARFVYLNKTAFNGLYRVNKSGDFNVPMGRYKDPNICDASAIWRASSALHGKTLMVADYRQTTAAATYGDVVYLDPPYDPAGDTANFTGYQSGGFTREHQVELATYAIDLANRGAFVMLSNNDTPFIRKLYRHPAFKISRVKCLRAINSNVADRGAVNEVLITAGPLPHRTRVRAHA